MLAELQPEDVPAESIFLLEIDSGKLTKEHVETQAYWVVALLIAARKAKTEQSAKAAREKRQSKRSQPGSY
jgi:hypothetical protein